MCHFTGLRLFGLPVACSAPYVDGFPPVSCAVPVFPVFGCVLDYFTMRICKVYLFLSVTQCRLSAPVPVSFPYWCCIGVACLVAWLSIVVVLLYGYRVEDGCRLFAVLPVCVLRVPCSLPLVGCFPVCCACAYTHPHTPRPPPPSLRNLYI